MDLAAQFREKGDSCALIFVTSSDAFAVASYDVQAAYLLEALIQTSSQRYWTPFRSSVHRIHDI